MVSVNFYEILYFNLTYLADRFMNKTVFKSLANKVLFNLLILSYHLV
jgi:hypothetical protein